MPIKQITIESVLGGWQSSKYFGMKDQFLNSIGIDPEMPDTDSDNKPSGLIRPTAMSKFSGANISAGTPLWFSTNPIDTNVYTYLTNGKFVSWDSALTNEALEGTITATGGNGMAYYDNAIYLAKNNDIARFYPLTSSPSVTQDYWTSTLSLGGLTDTTYPSILGQEIPNHPMFAHTDNKLYFGDVNNAGEGIISYIKTKKTTTQGDTNDGSTYEALDLPYKHSPTCISNYNDNLAIGVIEGVDTTIEQGNAKLVIWKPGAESFSIMAELGDPLITALRNVNGTLYVFSGSASGGCRVSRYLGGQTFEELAYLPDQYPPLQGAVDNLLNKLIWGGQTTEPSASASVFSIGGKSNALNLRVHNILKTTSIGANGFVSALKYVQQGATVQPIVAWKDDAIVGVDKLGTTYSSNTWSSALYRVGQNFTVKKIRIPFVQTLGANMTVKVNIVADGVSTEISEINSTNYSGKHVTLHPTIAGKNDFYIQLVWSGTALLTVGLPILVTYETKND